MNYPVRQVKLFVAAKGNHFMIEIARSFIACFETNQVPAEVLLDTLPEVQPAAGLVQLIVAPHEFYPLFLAQKLEVTELEQVSRACYMLNVEQPGSRFFERAFQPTRQSRGVLDINRQGQLEFARRKRFALYAPLSYSPYLEEGLSEPFQPVKKDIDIVFLGVNSRRRELFFSLHADLFNRYNCHFIFSGPERPSDGQTPGFYVERERNQLLKRSKILLNIHSSERDYFEWHRALLALANHCLLLSESSSFTSPLINGQHFGMTDLNSLAGLCQHYLENDQQRQMIIAEAYQFAGNALSARLHGQKLLHYLELAEAQPVATQPELSNFGLLAVATAPTKAASLLEPPSAAPLPTPDPQVLTLTEEVQALKDQLAEITATLKAQADPRREAREGLVRRLELVRQTELLGRLPWHEKINLAYQALAQPPAITVLVTLYNYAGPVLKCLDSLTQAQAQAENLPGGFEVVIIDDCSTDNSAAVVTHYIQTSALPIKFVGKHYNTGLSDTRNVGLRLGRGQYVFILDADNWIYPNCLEILYQATVQSGRSGAYSLSTRFDNQTGNGLGLLSLHAWDVQRLVYGPYIDAMALLDRQLLLDLGGYSSDMIQAGWLGLEDYELYLRLAQAGYSLAYVPRILSGYRVHRSSMLHQTNRYREAITKIIAQKYQDLAGRYPDLEIHFGMLRNLKPISEAGPAFYDGYVDFFSANVIMGWAWNSLQPEQVLELTVYYQGQPLEKIIADELRSDLLGLGMGRGFHGFVYIMPTATQPMQFADLEFRLPNGQLLPKIVTG